MIVTEIKDIQEIRNQILENQNYMSSRLNLASSLKVTSSNGYRIFKIDISEDDDFMDMENGAKLYTAVFPRFKDTRSIVLPIYTLKNKDKPLPYFKENQTEHDCDFRVFIGDGFVNIFAKYIEFRFIEYSILIVMDMMYDSRSDALQKLISLTE